MRMALGATTDRIVSMVLAGGAKLIAAGIVIGLAGSARRPRDARADLERLAVGPAVVRRRGGGAAGRRAPGDAVARTASHARQPGGRAQEAVGNLFAELQFRTGVTRYHGPRQLLPDNVVCRVEQRRWRGAGHHDCAENVAGHDGNQHRLNCSVLHRYKPSAPFHKAIMPSRWITPASGFDIRWPRQLPAAPGVAETVCSLPNARACPCAEQELPSSGTPSTFHVPVSLLPSILLPLIGSTSTSTCRVLRRRRSEILL